MRICPNDKFIEIFAQRFHYFEDPFYKFFSLNLLLQDTSYSLALKYSSFLFKFLSFAFYNINFWFKISKICIFLKFLTLEGTLVVSYCWCALRMKKKTIKAIYRQSTLWSVTYGTRKFKAKNVEHNDRKFFDSFLKHGYKIKIKIK